jgi:hypothetical protein
MSADRPIVSARLRPLRWRRVQTRVSGSRAASRLAIVLGETVFDRVNRAWRKFMPWHLTDMALYSISIDCDTNSTVHPQLMWSLRSL